MKGRYSQSDTASSAKVEMDEEKLTKRYATWVNNQGIATDAAHDAAIDAMTDAQLLTHVRRLLKALVRVSAQGGE